MDAKAIFVIALIAVVVLFAVYVAGYFMGVKDTEHMNNNDKIWKKSDPDEEEK